MNAHKCDRCSNFYLKNERFHPRGGKNVPIEGLYTYVQFGKPQYFDLCDDCLESFFDWYKERGEQNAAD